LNDLRDDSTRIERLDDDEKRRLLVAIDARRELVPRQRAIEDWAADWATAEAAAAR